MPYGCKLEDLLAILHDRAPAKADAVALQRRRVEHGLLSVGLKIHCLGNGSQFFSLVERLGGASKVLEINMYKHSQASLCLVLPPVGNARAAILLLECIERFTGSALFGNRKIQIQVCSPGRLDARRSALLAIGFYLGSDTLRRYAWGTLRQLSVEMRATNEDNASSSTTREEISSAASSGGRGPATARIVLSGPNCHSKMVVAICSPVTAVGWTSRTSISLRRCLSMPSTKAIGVSSASSLRRICNLCSIGICLPVWSTLRGSGPATLKVPTT